MAALPTVYDPEILRVAAHRLADLLADHFGAVQRRDGAVLNWVEPSENVISAGRCLDAGTQEPLGGDPDSIAGRFVTLVRTALSHGQNLHSPRYIGHQVPPPLPIAGLFDCVASATNQVMAIYEMGPWATAVEIALVNRLGARLGFRPGMFAGLVTHGGSMANLTALLTARNIALGTAWENGVSAAKPPVLVAHAEAHYCISRAAGVLGLGTRQLVKPALDARRRMCPDSLDATLHELAAQEQLVIAVAASACATPIGAFDDLNAIADVCERHGVWLHVDAAHGGAAIFSESHRHLLKGIERADSVVWDAHKMLFVPALCTFLFYRDRKHRYEAFRQDAPYLFDPSDPGAAEYDSGLSTLECTKRGAAFPLWGIWSLFGEQLFGELIDATFSLAKEFHLMLSGAEDFQPLHVPECNIVVFRYVPKSVQCWASAEIGALQREVRKTLVRSGKFYIVPTSQDGVAALRCTIINPLTTAQDLLELLTEIRRLGDERIAG